jgi:hypothetical protein
MLLDCGNPVGGMGEYGEYSDCNRNPLVLAGDTVKRICGKEACMAFCGKLDG